MEIDRDDICKKEMIRKLVSVFYYFDFMTRLVNICRHYVTYCNTAREMVWLKLINIHLLLFFDYTYNRRKILRFSFESKAGIIAMSPVVLNGIYRTLISCYTSRGTLYQRTT